MTAQPYNRFVYMSWSWHLPYNGNHAYTTHSGPGWQHQAPKKGFVLALRHMWLLKLNSSEHIKVYTFLFKINYLLNQFTSIEFTEAINSGDLLTYKTRMDLK